MAKKSKYKLTEEFIFIGSKKLFRIQALKKFGVIKKDSLGGFIEKENNLSQKGNCWVYSNAKIYGDAQVFGDAQIYGNSLIYGNAKVFGEAQVYDDAQVFGSAWIYNYAQVFGNVQVYGDAIVSGSAMVYGNAQVYGNAHVYDNAVIYDDAWPVSPFYVCLSKHQISSCSYTHLKIGCKILPIDEWKEMGKEFGKENGYSDTEIAFYTKTMLLAEEYIKLVKREEA